MTDSAEQASIAFVKPIRLSATVDRDIGSAFDLFANRMSSWWPLETHTFGPGRPHTLVLEGRVGGRFFERYDDGSEHDIGRVTRWDPPSLLGFTWLHDDWSAPTEVIVRFSPRDDGSTFVEVEHRGWELLGAVGETNRESYANGWPTVFGLYLEAANRPVNGAP